MFNLSMASSNTFVTAGDITEAQSFTNFVFAPVEETNELAGEHTYSIIDDPEKGDTLVHITPMQIEGQSQNIINETVGPNDNNFQDRVTSTLVQEGVNVEVCSFTFTFVEYLDPQALKAI